MTGMVVVWCRAILWIEALRVLDSSVIVRVRGKVPRLRHSTQRRQTIYTSAWVLCGARRFKPITANPTPPRLADLIWLHPDDIHNWAFNHVNSLSLIARASKRGTNTCSTPRWSTSGVPPITTTDAGTVYVDRRRKLVMYETAEEHEKDRGREGFSALRVG
ncbi:hypothetical protein BJ165DRAFT_1407159 [Panaeolus papilionaceus]|nr:hypothetical protein BJ165DRAFT_1407159 [Panaeolus papilionaceus]